jgi:hypothetical protein
MCIIQIKIILTFYEILKSSWLEWFEQEYLNSIEILNRQSLPLRSNFNQKVQEYFIKND